MTHALQDVDYDNLHLLEQLYIQYSEDPFSLNREWQRFFSSVEHESTGRPIPTDDKLSSDLLIAKFIRVYRTYGHLAASVNPIAIDKPEEPWQFKLESLGLHSQDLQKTFPTLGILSRPTAPLQDILTALKGIYCDKIGFEYMELENPALEKWLQERIESSHFKESLTIDQKKMILSQLNRSELFESFIHTKYTGQKRFSLEGAETLIPMLEAIIETGSSLKLEQFVIGMAHRGRLNVLSNILKKSYADIFSEFEENYLPYSFEGSGDVKYHKGFSSVVLTPDGHKVQITLAPNASHLESVDSIVEGQTFAKQVLINDHKKEKVIPILVHGDAAIAGQGVVYETMQLYRLSGYATGGTLHFVINNQVGFTASPEETRSTRYCTDIARTFSAPVFHVNAEDPEGCVLVTNLALQIRQQFHCDVFIEINCYRKYGHNEADEPAYTQPLEYQQIRKKRPIRELYRDQLIHEGVVEKHIAEDLEKEFSNSLQEALQISKQSLEKDMRHNHDNQNLAGIAGKQSDTKVKRKILEEVAEGLSRIPENLEIHPKIRTLIQERHRMVTSENKSLDWGMAELLAYGSLLWEGVDIRLSGQDSRRGTFSHRHAIWMDQQKEKAYIPLNYIRKHQGHFDVINSPLSEYGVLGFEFGYSVANPVALVIWEAQFGDFCNCAQVMIDQYIATAEQKWGLKFALTMLLPHGYEGQGPEHSSARMERFLALAGNENMRIVNPTTPAQFFHLLRKQALNPVKKPLIVFTPKGLLRHPLATSQLQELIEGAFQEMISPPMDKQIFEKVIFCSGRFYYDLLAEKEQRKLDKLGLIRIEQLYPLNVDLLKSLFEQNANCPTFLWAQEEPSNMGAGDYIRPFFEQLLPKGKSLRFLARPRSASSAVGSYALHKKQHAQLMKEIFDED